MKSKVVYETFDGKTHDSKRQAIKYLEVMYEQTLGKITDHVCSTTTAMYNKTVTYDILNSHIEDFRFLLQIKEDMNLIEDED